MAGKRSATSDLNHDNWNQEEEPEEQGTFQKASEDALKERIIKTARRRNPIRSEDSENKSAFVGFTGFSSKPPSTDFSFLKDISKSDSAPKTNGIDKPDAVAFNPSANIFSNPQKSTTSIFGAIPTTSISTNIFGSSTATSASSTVVPSSSATGIRKSEKYCSRLKGLNESVSKWIVKKVEENPLISLQPIFKDYEKYLEEIEEEESRATDKQGSAPVTMPVPTFNFNPATDKNVKSVPESESKKSEEKDAKSVPTFTFTPSTTSSSSAATFSFGSANNAVGAPKSFSSFNTTTSVTSGFSFGSSTQPSSTGFTFGGAPKPSADASKDKPSEEENNEEEDGPPKVEFKPVVEKDHLFTIKCKVFVRKDDNFGDRGVGNLYLKPIENSEKVQLIVRADTNLGNLLLNFILSENVPTKRMGKRDVMLVAIPTPDSKPPPTPILVRVKSPEEADNLLEVLKKHKK